MIKPASILDRDCRLQTFDKRYRFPLFFDLRRILMIAQTANAKKFGKYRRGRLRCIGYTANRKHDCWDVVLRFEVRSRFMFVEDTSNGKRYRFDFYPLVDWAKYLRK